MEKNIFENTKFGEHFTFKGNDSIFLEKYSDCDLYKLVVNVIEDNQSWTYNINAKPDGFVYADDVEDNPNEIGTKYYVIKSIDV